MSRFGDLINSLEQDHQQDIKTTSRLLGVTATLYQRLQGILDHHPTQSSRLLTGQSITKTLLIERYGNYDGAYAAYKKAYGIQCKRGWENLLALAQNWPLPVTLEERVTKLEDTVQALSEMMMALLQEPN